MGTTIGTPERAEPAAPSSCTPSSWTAAGAATVLAVEIESGPAVDALIALPAGRHVVGRARGVGVAVDDALVEPHHAVLAVAADGTASLLHLTGRLPVLVDGDPVAGWVAVGAGSTIDIGASRLRLRPPPPRQRPPQTGEVPGERWRRMLVRSPRAVPFVALPAVDPPAGSPAAAAPGSPGMLVGAAGGLIGGLAMAWITGSVMMAAFGVVAASVSAATWCVARVRRGRESGRRRRDASAELEAFAAAVAAGSERIRTHHVATVVSAARRLGAAEDHELWSRRAEHGDAFTVSLGRGDVERATPIGGDPSRALDAEVLAIVERHRTLRDVSVPVALDAHERHVIAIEGPGADSVIRSMLLQLAITTGPADWCARAIVSDPATCDWLRQLPHAATGDGRPCVVDATDPATLADAVLGLDDGDARRVVIACDTPALLATRTGPLRRLLDGDRPVTVLLAVADGEAVPAVCASSLRIGSRGTGRWVADLHDAAAAWGSTVVHPAGASIGVAERVAGQLARYVDPEDPSAAAGRLPVRVRLVDLPGVPDTADEVVDAWSEAGCDAPLAAVVGTSVDGVIEIDLVRDGPHGLVAGTTGSGKSELLRALVVALAARVPPDQLSFVLVDYKGGATFDACATLPHTVGVVTDLDAGLAERALVSLEAELHRRERLLREHGAADLAAYRASADPSAPARPPLARLVVVIDEFAALASDLPDFLAALVGVAQRGRSLGIHLVLATQRPAGVVDDAIRANTNLRVALRLHDVGDAVDVVGDRGPATFARGVPGRAMLRLGPDEVVEFQAAVCTSPPVDAEAGATDLAVLVDAIEAAADRLGVAAPHRPWLPPLGETTGVELEPGAIGLVDDPAGQRRRPLRWSGTGNLALVGALGAGTTTTLVAIARSLPAAVRDRAGTGSAANVHVIDGRGDAALDPLAELPHCAGVVRLHEHERIWRLLERLVGVIDARRAGGATDPRLDTAEVLLVDGLVALRRSLDDPGRVATASALDRVLAEGPAVGVVTVAMVEPEGGAVHSLLGRFAERWVFHLDDPSAGTGAGVPAGRIPAAIPGRLVIASEGLEAQVRPSTEADVPTGAPPTEQPAVVAPPIEVLPAVVARSDLVADARCPAADALEMPVGRRFDDLSVASVELTAGARLMVAGPVRSGRSSLLVLLAEAWCGSNPDGAVTVVCGSARSPLARSRWSPVDTARLADRMARLGGPHLVVVDDGERVTDHAGVLASLAEPGAADRATFVVAGRADALRSSFDHWSAPLRRHRAGFVMTATHDLDADVLGVAPPRRCPIAPRPGLAWMVAHGDCTLVQVALPDA